jgi:hypothetical protein
VLTLILYSPVIIFGSGIKSLVANDIVKSETMNDFLENFSIRSRNTWRGWMADINIQIKRMFTFGFLISLFFYRKVSNQRLPMQVFLILGALIMVTLQRVAPLPRIWGYLEVFYLFFSVAGLVWFACWILMSIWNEQTAAKILNGLILLIVLFVLAGLTIQTQSRAARADRTIAPEFFAAEYIADHITAHDTIIAVAPADIQTAYYLKIMGVPYERYYQRDRPKEIENALVLVRTRGEYKINTLDKVINFYQLTDKLDVDQAEQVFEYGPLLIYSIPSK